MNSLRLLIFLVLSFTNFKINSDPAIAIAAYATIAITSMFPDVITILLQIPSVCEAGKRPIYKLESNCFGFVINAL
jgi:hypothetical protein